MIENGNTDNSSLSSIHITKKENIIITERITEENNSLGFLKVISEVLTDTCEQARLHKDEKLLLVKLFMTKKRPNISIFEFIKRLYDYSQTSEDIFIIVLIYIERLKTNRKICLNYFNIYKLILASFITAIKMNSDEIYTLEFFSKLGGISKKDIASLEYQFISLLDFKLLVEEKLFYKYDNYLRSVSIDNEEDCYYDSDG